MQSTQSIPESTGPELWQLRNIPTDLKRSAKAQAALEGRSESEMVTDALRLYLRTKKES